MIVFGLLLILIAAGAAVFAVMAPAGTVQTIELSALGVTVSASPLAMFVAGALAVLLFTVGLALINRGARRRSSSRKELRELRKGQAEAAATATTESGRHSSGHDRSPDGSRSTDEGNATSTDTRTDP